MPFIMPMKDLRNTTETLKIAYKEQESTFITQNGYWYKQNRVGYEGTAEYLSSLVLSCSNVNEFVIYEQCKINGRAECRSKNFLQSETSYIIIVSALLLMRHTGNTKMRLYLIMEAL